MDIVERLRELSTWDMPELKYAADEIERLREYIKNWKDTDSAAIMALSQAQEEVKRLRSERDELKKTAFMKDVIGSANWKQVCKENEQMREALNEIRFRIDNMPQDMSLTPNSAIFDLIRYLTNMALGEKK
jgi:hypothetical protein